MLRLFYRTKTSTAKAIKPFDLEKVKCQLDTAEDFIINKLKDLKPDTAMEGNLLSNLEITIARRTVKLKELAEVSQKNSSHWMVLVSEESWKNQISKAIKNAFPHLSPSEKDEHTLLIPVPPVSKERKLEVLKDIKLTVENTRNSIRNIRASARSDLKKGGFTKDEIFKNEKQIQDMVDSSLVKVDQIFKEKQKSFEKLGSKI